MFIKLGLRGFKFVYDTVPIQVELDHHPPYRAQARALESNPTSTFCAVLLMTYYSNYCAPLQYRKTQFNQLSPEQML